MATIADIKKDKEVVEVTKEGEMVTIHKYEFREEKRTVQDIEGEIAMHEDEKDRIDERIAKLQSLIK